MSEQLKFLAGEPPVEGGARAPKAAAPRSVIENGPRGATAGMASRPVEAGQVPIAALLDERERRRAEQAHREALEQRIAEMEARATPQREPEPHEQLEMALYNQNLRACRRFAERQYGKGAVAHIHDWAAQRCDEDPHFNAQMHASEDPYEAAYQAYQREQILQAVKPRDLAAFKAWQAANGRRPDADASRPSPQTPRVPRSLATASGTGGAGSPHVPVGAGLAFGSAFSR